MIVRVGLCGFTMPMKDYARHFPVVEVQSTFYEPPLDTVMMKWPTGGTPPLEYTMKVWQLVTHAANSPTYRRMMRPLDPKDEPGCFRDSPIVREGWERSVECANLLSATAMLFQCPASFDPQPENVDRMRRFFERIKTATRAFVVGAARTKVSGPTRPGTFTMLRSGSDPRGRSICDASRTGASGLLAAPRYHRASPLIQ